MTDNQDPRLRDLARAAAPGLVDNVTAAILSGLHADPLTAAAAGGFLGLAVAFDMATGQRRAERLAQLLEDTSTDMGGPDVLAHRALATDETAELTRRILEAAARTTHEDKIRALSRVLVTALEDTAKVDHATLLANALSDLDGPHIRVMRLVEETVTQQGAGGGLLMHPGMRLPDLRNAVHGDRDAVDALTFQLTYHGLIRDDGAGQADPAREPRYVVTDLGRELLDLLTDHAPG